MTPKEHNPNQNLVIPKWVNEEYFEEILQKDVPNYERVASFKAIAATAPGENFASIMVRVLISVELKDGTIQPQSYILKTCLNEGAGANLISAMNLFPRETQSYKILLPKFEDLYRNAGLKIQFGPKCLNIETTPEHITLVMEDLKVKNFTNVDRLKGMDMEHVTRVLQKIAEYHAVSVVYKELNGPFDDVYMTGFYKEENREAFTSLAGPRREVMRRAMRTWGLENEEYYIKNFPSLEISFDKGLRLNEVDPNEFNVLNHGDCWSNNVMFNYKESGEVDEVLFVDFQVGKWGTPAQDLWYFLTTSPNLDIKIKEFDRFIQIYQQRLMECLKLLKYTKHIPTLKEMHILMLKYGNWGVFTAHSTLCVDLFPSDTDANMDNLFKTGPEAAEFRFKLISSPLYAKAMCQLYPFFNVKGIFHVETVNEDK